jgi:hypothetical protein
MAARVCPAEAAGRRAEIAESVAVRAI